MKSLFKTLGYSLVLAMVLWGCGGNPADSAEHKEMMAEHEEMEAEHTEMMNAHAEMEKAFWDHTRIKNFADAYPKGERLKKLLATPPYLQY